MQVKPLLTGWLMLSIGVFALSLLHRSDTPLFFGRYSASYAIQLIILLAGIGISGVLSMLAWMGRLSRLWQSKGLKPVVGMLPALTHPPVVWIVSGVIIAALLLFWLFMPGARHQPTILLFRVYIVLTGLAGLILLLRDSEAAQQKISRRALLGLSALFVLLMVILTLSLVGRVPRSIIFDEPWLADWGYSMFITGQPVIASFPDQPPGYTALWSILMPVQGLWLHLTEISLSNARLFWLLVCWLSAPFIYLAANLLYGRAAALSGVVIVALVPLFHNYVRPDMFVPVMLSVALWLLFTARQTGQRRRYFAAGFALAFAVEGHVTAARFALAAGILFSAEYALIVWKARRWTWYAPFWCFAAGGLLFAVIFPFLHTTLWGLPVGDLFSSGSSYYAADAAFWADYGAGQPKWWVIVQDTLINYWYFSPLELALLLLAVVAAFRRRDSHSRYLAALLLLAFAVSLVTLPKTSRYYFIHNLPFVALLGGALLAQVTEKFAHIPTRAGHRPAPTDNTNVVGAHGNAPENMPQNDSGISIAQIILTAAGILLMVAQLVIISFDGQSIDRAIDIGYEAYAVLPPETTLILGRQFYWWGLHDRDFMALENLINYIRLEDRPAYLENLAPQAFLMTAGLDQEQTYIYDYIEAHEFIAAHCFDLDIYRRVVILYLPRAVLPPETTPCAEGMY